MTHTSITVLFQAVTVSSVVINPLVYIIYHQKYRQAILVVLRMPEQFITYLDTTGATTVDDAAPHTATHRLSRLPPRTTTTNELR